MEKHNGMKMWRNGKNMKKYGNKSVKRILTLMLVCTLLTISISSVVTSFSSTTKTLNNTVTCMNTFDDDFMFIWEDTFNTTEKIDDEFSENYVVKDGKVSMFGTYETWTDSDWTRMKPITIQSDDTIENCIISLQIEYDSDMQADYDDLRFKYKNETAYAPYWIEQRNPEPNTPYASLWVRLSNVPDGSSTLYMFYGNTMADEYSQYDAVFDETSWQKQFAHDEQVTYHMAQEGAWDPEVTWGNDLFLVTWEEGQPYSIVPPMLFQQQIRGCFYDEDGNTYGTRFDITDVESPPYRNENPSAASNDDIFFVAFEKYTNPLTNQHNDKDIYGSIVTSSGDSSVFQICTASGIQADPFVIYDHISDKFLVVWEDGREGTSNYNIYGRFFSDTGVAVSSEIILASRPHTQCEPWVVLDQNHHHFYMVWEEGVTPDQGPFDIWGQMFDSTLNTLGSTIRLSQVSSASEDYNFPCVSYSPVADCFLVTWQKDDISSGDWTGPIYGQLLDNNGDTINDIFLIESGEFERSTVVTYLSSSFFVAFDGGGDVWGRPVSSSGEIYDYILQLSDSESDPADWASMASNNNELFLVWEDLRIEYAPPYESLNMPDVFTNIWSFNTPQSAAVSTVFGTERSIILEATLVSHPIEPENLLEWQEFDALKTGSVNFDILQGNTLDPIRMDVSPGESLSSIQDYTIRLRARFTRSSPSTSPDLDQWSVSFQGADYRDPETSIDHIDGVEGLNEWYTSESVTVWLHAEDLPEETGSGVEQVYYQIDNGVHHEYDELSGIHLTVTHEMQWTKEWQLTFWSVDRSGNVEDKTRPENKAVIKIDADRPFVTITSPVDEEQVEVPFLVEVNASDNVGVTKVAFDIEPFGERDGLPYIDTEPPFEWYCDVEQGSASVMISEDVFPAGINVMIRARAYDDAGQTWTHEMWIYIKNWDDSDGFYNGIGFIAGFGHLENLQISDPFDISSRCFVIGDLSWQFDEGVTLSIGDQGAYTMTGSQTGFAEMFIGISNRKRTVFFGFATGISVD